MPDRNDVIADIVDHIEATLAVDSEYVTIPLDLLQYAIALLKEQETKDTGKRRIFECEKCGYGIDDIFLAEEEKYPIDPVYCPNCGRVVKQE